MSAKSVGQKYFCLTDCTHSPFPLAVSVQALYPVSHPMPRWSLYVLGVIIAVLAVFALQRQGVIPVILPILSGDQSSSASSAGAVVANRETQCGDRVDNDGDGGADCADADCMRVASCRCNTLSCGDPKDRTSKFTCLREEGCICDEKNGCVPCRGEKQSCGDGSDCCTGFGLTCQEILLGGKREKQCLPLPQTVCTIVCEGKDGTTGEWSSPTGCATDRVPENTPDCETLRGTCNRSPNEERNTRKCWQS